MDEDEDVVDADGKDEKRNHFDDDEGRRDTEVAEETNAGRHRRQHDQHAAQTQHQLHVDLQRQPITTLVGVRLRPKSGVAPRWVTVAGTPRQLRLPILDATDASTLHRPSTSFISIYGDNQSQHSGLHTDGVAP